MRSTTKPISKRTAFIITRATWRWCARSIEKIPVILSSATPSVETEVNARRGRYRRLPLPERFGGQHLPHIEAIDMKAGGPPRGRFIAPRLVEAVQYGARARRAGACCSSIAAAMRRSRLCRACGHRFACPNCDAWLVDHRFKRRLVCHHCGFGMPVPEACPQCEATDTLRGGRSRRRAAGGRSADAVSRQAQHRAVERSGGIGRPPARRTRRRRRRPIRHRHRHAARRQGPSFPEAQSRRHCRCRSWPCATAIRARPSARFSCCIRSRAAPAAKRGGALAFCRRISRSIR